MHKTLIAVLLAMAASMACGSPAVKKPTDSDDRPPIIVTNGSIRFDDGGSDNSKWKDWTQANGNSNKKQWTQKYPTGSDVSSFTVDIAGSNQNCPASTPKVFAVALEYTARSGDKSLVTVQRVQWGGSGNKMEPWVTAPTDMSATPGGGAPSRLVYDTDGGGSISNITLTTSGAPTSCSTTGSTDLKITIQPK